MAGAVTIGSAFKQEFYKLTVLSLGLVVFQILLSILGSTGFINTIFMYLLAIFVSGMFDIDLDEANLISTANIPVAGWIQWVEVLGDIITLFSGMLLWVILGVLKGVDAAIPSGDSPDDILRKVSGGNVFLKLLYAFISHISIMAFLRFWVNLFQGIKSFFIGESPPSSRANGSRRRR